MNMRINASLGQANKKGTQVWKNNKILHEKTSNSNETVK